MYAKLQLMDPESNQQTERPHVSVTPLPPTQDNNKQKQVPNIVPVGLVLALFIPPVGAAVSLIAWRRVVKQSLGGKGSAITGVVLGVILTPVAVIFYSLYFVLGGGFFGPHANDAEKTAKPFMAQIKQLGGKKICDNGDSGHGLDNRKPWYQIYYTVPDTKALTDQVNDIAGKQGYSLSPDTELMRQLQGLPDKDGSHTTPYLDQSFSQKSDYLIAHNGGNTLNIIINRQTSVALNCDTVEYGRKQPTGEDEAIIDASFQLPDVN